MVIRCVTKTPNSFSIRRQADVQATKNGDIWHKPLPNQIHGPGNRDLSSRLDGEDDEESCRREARSGERRFKEIRESVIQGTVYSILNPTYSWFRQS
jgi:hypothetical protein